MNKINLLTKSHFRKNRGTSIALFLLMLMASMMVTLAMLLFTDVYPMADKEASRLDAGNGYFLLHSDIEAFDEDTIASIFSEDVEKKTVFHCLNYGVNSLDFGDGASTTTVIVNDHSALEKSMGKTEIVEEDTSISSNYLYLPYQFYTSGGYKMGDQYSFELGSSKMTLTIKGFTLSTYFLNNNAGTFELIVDDATYANMLEKDQDMYASTGVIYDLKDDVKQSAFEIKTTNKILSYDPNTSITSGSRDNVISNQTFMPLIISISFFSITLIVLVVIILMLGNTISNFVRENMKTLGALKAIGYTSSDIKASLRLQFLLLALAGSIFGTILGFVLMPVVASFCVSPMGIPYSVSLTVLPILIAISAVVLFTLLASQIALRKIKKIEPIVALRDGTESHNFKKNHVALENSPFNLNLSLSMKTMIFNKKQNIITFFVIGLLMFLCVVALLMFENFNRHPNVKILTTEISDGILLMDSETKLDAQAYLEGRSDVQNVRRGVMMHISHEEEAQLYTYAFEDPSKMNNTDCCYKGSLPKYDNEIALSGKYARDNGFKIGDEIKLTYADKSYSYVITGFVQSTDEAGRLVITSVKALAHIVDLEHAPENLLFDCEDEDTDKILEDVEKEFGDHVLSKMNFNASIEGAMTTFRSIAALMLTVVFSITVCVILLILFLLIKSLLHTKRKDYGIYKAIGYTSKDLIFQTAVSFMPSIILSVMIYSVVSYFAATPYITLIMSSFGIMKGNFAIPIPGVILISITMILVSFIFAVFESRRIKKIEAYNMLVAE